jgi:hypothetical protein
MGENTIAFFFNETLWIVMDLFVFLDMLMINYFYMNLSMSNVGINYLHIILSMSNVCLNYLYRKTGLGVLGCVFVYLFLCFKNIFKIFKIYFFFVLLPNFLSMFLINLQKKPKK